MLFIAQAMCYDTTHCKQQQFYTEPKLTSQFPPLVASLFNCSILSLTFASLQ